MSDVRAAEERMRAWLALPEPKGITDRHYDGGVGQYDIDSEILVNAYLAEHPADDGEPITREWFRSVSANGNHWIHCPGGDVYLRGDGRVELTFDEGLDAFIIQNHIKTRGDVRRLCRALGVEVKE